jgi:superfamily II DNA or RNA helicase
MIRVIVDNRLRLQESDLPDGLVESLKDDFQHSNPSYFRQRQRVIAWGRKRGRNIDPTAIKVKGEPPVIVAWQSDGRGGLSFPRGGTTIIRQAFERHGLGEPDWDDKRVAGTRAMGMQMADYAHRVQLWEHQDEIVAAVMERENCLVRAETGSGKTTAAIAFAVKVGLPTIIIVWSVNLFDQWIERLTKELGLNLDEIGQIHGSRRTLGPITMAMQRTLYANPNFLSKIAPKFGCVMADEVQRFAARTFNDVIDKFPARYRVGFSADEHRKDKKEFLIYDAFGTVAVDIGRDEVVKRKLVLDVEVRVIPTEFRADWYREQQRVESPDFNRLLEEIVNDKGRNLTALSIARTMLGLGHQVLMFTHRREHAASFVRAALENGTRAGLLLGGPENEAEFASTVKAIRAQEMKFAAGTYQAIGQGMDVPSVSRGVACTPIASNRQFFGQVRGRLCRRCDGKKDAVLYYLWDQHVFGLETIMNLRRWNRVVMVESDSGWLTADDFIVEWNKRRKK